MKNYKTLHVQMKKVVANIIVLLQTSNLIVFRKNFVWNLSAREFRFEALTSC